MGKNLYTSDRLLYYIDKCQKGLFDDYVYIIDDVNTHESDGIIHGDLFPDNAHFIDNRLTGVFDFTGACNGSFYFDLAVVAMSWCFEETRLNKDSLDSLIHHYLEASPIQDFTYQRFIKWMKYGALYYAAQRCYMNINRPDHPIDRDHEEFIQKIDCLEKMEGHGGDIYTFAKRAGVRAEEVIDFSSNINFVKPNVNIDLNGLNLLPYPDPDYRDLRDAFNDLYSIPEGCDMEFYNGASAGIFSLFRSLKPQDCILYAPIYSEYKKAADLFASHTILVNRLDDLYYEPPQASLVVFVHPSTPDGNVYPIESLLQHWKNKASHILIDESFLDFTEALSVVPLLEEYPSLYVLKSMSKFYSGAGIRVGAVLSDRENIRVLRSHEPMWKLSSFDTRYIMDILKDTDFINRTKESTLKNKSLLIQILEESGLFEEIYDSQANFVLTRLKDLNGHDLQDRLTDHRILVRVCDNFDFLSPSYIRFAVKKQEDLETLERAFKCLL
ncbi:MAG TPA: aminotransferase class I/II-fold pyridoxal phosphate-dependent enzyme [Spirochaetes bacterium]|nr:aminotransferase class I/II-fold pyridoxal phosphate-dependent enzyme [Spirochaetota bacterium]